MERGLAAVNALVEHRVFHFGHGRFGLGPNATRDSDLLAVLFGGVVPYILRPLEGGSWALVGECLVPGLMQGEEVEAVELWAPGTMRRTEHGILNLDLKKSDEVDLRFHRKIEERGVRGFEIR
ncbi:Heterokaryon incompatibility protein [Paramyrothecium foliicola]|nr:Heterokaryon incompatibility protein [Paramyrothecium foliicola]